MQALRESLSFACIHNQNKRSNNAPAKDFTIFQLLPIPQKKTCLERLQRITLQRMGEHNERFPIYQPEGVIMGIAVSPQGQAP